EAVSDRLLEPRRRVRRERTREQGLAVLVEYREPLRRGVARRRRPLVRVASLARRPAGERAQGPLAPVAPGADHAGPRPAGAPLAGRGDLREVRRRDGHSGRAQPSHRLTDLVDDGRRRQLGALSFQISTDPLLLVGHGGHGPPLYAARASRTSRRPRRGASPRDAHPPALLDRASAPT